TCWMAVGWFCSVWLDVIIPETVSGPCTVAADIVRRVADELPQVPFRRGSILIIALVEEKRSAEITIFVFPPRECRTRALKAARFRRVSCSTNGPTATKMIRIRWTLIAVGVR